MNAPDPAIGNTGSNYGSNKSAVTRGRVWLVGAAIAVTGAIGLPTLASAATPSVAPAPAAPPEVPPSLQERLDLLCARIPNLQTRTTNLITRLESDAETRGSLAWLTAQVTRARANGREDFAVVLENRLAVRTAMLDVLKLRVVALADAAVYCDGRGE